MSKLIEFKHIYENAVCTDSRKLLIFIKNILANCKRERLFHYPEGYTIPLRWSKPKNKIVIDLGTNLDRDIQGIDKDNIRTNFAKNPIFQHILENLLENIDSSKLNDYYNIEKNQSKFIAIVYCLKTEEYYNLGLYSFAKTHKRIGVYHRSKKSILLDNSKEFKKNINNMYSIIKPINSYIIKVYSNLYYDFINYLNSKSYMFKLNNRKIDISLQEIVENNLKFEYSLSHKRNKEILISKEILEKEELIFKNNIARYLISVEFFNFMIENNIINSYAYYYDDRTDTNYKIKNFDKLSFNSKEVEKNNKEDLNPYILLPLKV